MIEEKEGEAEDTEDQARSGDEERGHGSGANSNPVRARMKPRRKKVPASIVGGCEEGEGAEDKCDVQGKKVVFD
jgi:hypothetical protein